jgi:hypothetical protein
VRPAQESFSKSFWLTLRVFFSSDWVPAIVKSGLAMGVLPDIKAVVAWIPVDETAQAITELTFASSHRPLQATPKSRHIVHPRPVSWLDIWTPIAVHLELLCSKSIKIIPYDQWLDAFRESAAAHSNKDSLEAVALSNPPIKLLTTTFDGRSCACFEELAGRKGSKAVDSLGSRRLSRLDKNGVHLGYGLLVNVDAVIFTTGFSSYGTAWLTLYH